MLSKKKIELSTNATFMTINLKILIGIAYLSAWALTAGNF